MHPPHASVFFFCNLSSFADGLRQAGLCHFPRNVGKGRPGTVLLCQLLRHSLIMSPIGRQEWSIRTSILESYPPGTDDTVTHRFAGSDQSKPADAPQPSALQTKDWSFISSPKPVCSANACTELCHESAVGI